MTAEQVRALGPAFAAYLRPFEPCFVDCSTAEHLHTYCRGLLSDLPRKSVEPIARAAGAGVRPSLVVASIGRFWYIPPVPRLQEELRQARTDLAADKRRVQWPGGSGLGDAC